MALRTALAATYPALASAKKNGTTGTNAPIANAMNEPIAAPQGDPSEPGSSPSSSRTNVSSAIFGSAIRLAAVLSACSCERPLAR